MRAILLMLALATSAAADPKVPPQAPPVEFVWAITDHANADKPGQGPAVIELRETPRRVVVTQRPAAESWGESAVAVRKVATPVRSVLFGRRGGRSASAGGGG